GEIRRQPQGDASISCANGPGACHGRTVCDFNLNASVTSVHVEMVIAAVSANVAIVSVDVKGSIERARFDVPVARLQTCSTANVVHINRAVAGVDVQVSSSRNGQLNPH